MLLKGEHVTPVLSMFPEFIAAVANLGPSERFNELKWHFAHLWGTDVLRVCHETFLMQYSSWSDSRAMTNNGRDTN